MAGMIVGYARTSTADQEAGFEAQIRELEELGCEKIFKEQVSSVAKRGELEECMRFLREGDTLVVTKPDRLARSTGQLLTIQAELERRKIHLVVQSMGLDTRVNNANPTTRLQLTILAAVAQFERELMLERQREGIAAAKKAGKYKGRKPKARLQKDQITTLVRAGVSKDRIAERLNISRTSVYRIVKEAR